MQLYQPINNQVKRHIDSNTSILGDFNTPLSAKDRSSRPKIIKETRASEWHTGPNGLHGYIQKIPF